MEYELTVEGRRRLLVDAEGFEGAADGETGVGAAERNIGDTCDGGGPDPVAR